MKYRLAEDAQPQLKLLLIATLITIALWFLPYIGVVTYPVRLFVTFVHEGSHVLAALLTGGSVRSLTVSPDTSGLVQTSSSFLSGLITSSAGYLGATAFGVLLLLLIRRAYSARSILLGSAGFIGVMTLVFGLLAPIWNLFEGEITLGSQAFTVLSGILLIAGLVAIAKYASDRWANFSLAFLAIQCILNAFYDLNVLFLNHAPLTGLNEHSDAQNMYEATGIPGIVWVLIWIGISILMISLGLRFYAVRQKSKQNDLPFED